MLRHLQLLAWLLLVAGIGGCAVLGSYSPTARLESRGIFQPAKYPKGDWNQTAVLVRDANFAAADGTKLHGWYVSHDRPKGHALLLHGSAGNVTLLAVRLPNGIQINDGLNWNRSDSEATVTSTSSPRSCLTLIAGEVASKDRTR